MVERSRPSVDASYVFDLLRAANQVLTQESVHDLSEKVTVVKMYFELSRTSSQSDYGPVLRRAVRELSFALQKQSIFST
jgi:hypothetical protein